MTISTEETRSRNKDLSRRFLNELWDQKNVAVIDELLADTYVDHTPPLRPFDEGLQGPEAFKQLFETISLQFIDIHASIEDQIAEEDKVMTRVTWKCTLKSDDPSTATPVTVMGVGIDRIDDGKIVENWNTLDVLYRLLNLLEKPDDISAVSPGLLQPRRGGGPPVPCSPASPCPPGFTCQSGTCQRV